MPLPFRFLSFDPSSLQVPDQPTKRAETVSAAPTMAMTSPFLDSLCYAAGAELGASIVLPLVTCVPVLSKEIGGAIPGERIAFSHLEKWIAFRLYRVRPLRKLPKNSTTR